MLVHKIVPIIQGSRSMSVLKKGIQALAAHPRPHDQFLCPFWRVELIIVQGCSKDMTELVHQKLSILRPVQHVLKGNQARPLDLLLNPSLSTKYASNPILSSKSLFQPYEALQILGHNQNLGCRFIFCLFRIVSLEQ